MLVERNSILAIEVSEALIFIPRVPLGLCSSHFSMFYVILMIELSCILQ